jgi:hypothetical protein
MITVQFAVLFCVARATHAAIIPVGPTRSITTPCAAASVAQNGDTVQIDAGAYPGQACIWSQNNLTIMGVGNGRASLTPPATIPNLKGIFVVDGANFTAENLEFSNAKVVDQNGAGIRAEGSGTFTVRNCYFHDNEDGILGPDSGDALIENSIFDHNGFGDGQSHNMYIGIINSFTLRYSYTHRANVGQEVKSRARTNYILYNRIMDEADGTSSYSIDISQGGLTYIIGNIIEQGPNNQNDIIIGYAEENANNGVLKLYAINNTLINNYSNGIFFDLRSGTTARIANNIFYGAGTRWSRGTVTASNNYFDSNLDNAPKFANPQTYDFHLTANSPSGASGIIDAGVAPGTSAEGFDMTPVFQYVYDIQEVGRTVVGAATDIGAFEFSTGAPPPPPSSPCDVNGDGTTNVADVQLEVNMALGISSCANPSGTCSVVSVQRVVNAALGGLCVSP